MSHPRLAGLSPEQLAYRAIALCRIAQILDSVLYLVSGPSMLTDRTFCPNKFRLDSFTESSFVSSWQYSESSGSPRLVSKRKDGLSLCDMEGKADVSPKDETNHQQEVIVKKKTALRVSLERYKEQLRTVKNKVRTYICVIGTHFIHGFIHSYYSFLITVLSHRAIGSRLLARWVSKRLVDGHLLKKIILFFICCLINFSFEQAL